MTEPSTSVASPQLTVKRVLITGVTGQDGSYMADYLLTNTDHLIYGMVRRTSKPDYGNLTAALANPRFKLVVGDLSDSTSIDNVVKEVRPDYLINLAAQSFVGSSWTLVEQTLDATGIAVARLLEAVRKHAPHCRTYSAGSSEQWGDVTYTPQDERHPMRPRSPYGCAKCLAAHLVKVYRESYGLYAVHGVLTNHESERRGAEFVTRKVTLGVARIAAAIQAGQPFEPIELGNLDARRDWSHAEDFVDGMWRMLNQEVYCPTTGKAAHDEWVNTYASSEGDVIPILSKHLVEYVLSSNETHTVREFIERAFAVAGLHIQWAGDGKYEAGYSTEVHESNGQGWTDTHHLVRINPAFYRPAEVDLLWGDSTRARTELGWQPKVSFDQLVTRMVRSDMAAHEADQRAAA